MTDQINRHNEREVEERRLEALPFLETNTPHKEIAERFGVALRTVRSWKTRYRREGEEGLKATEPFHRPSKLSSTEKQELAQAIIDGAEKAGFNSDLWTCPRIQKLIKDRFGVHYHVDYLPTFLHNLGFSPQKPQNEARERDPERITGWIRTEWKDIKKARRTGAKIVLLDESALLLSPLVKRTWAPVGKTPVISTKMSGRRKISLIGALSVDIARKDVEFLFQVLKDENVNTTYFLAFLEALLITLHGKIIVVVDNLKVHRAKAVTEFVFSNRRRLSIEYLPPYAPELNPVEYVWADLKYHELANYTPHDVDELERKALYEGIRISWKKKILRACLTHSPLLFWRE